MQRLNLVNRLPQLLPRSGQRCETGLFAHNQELLSNPSCFGSFRSFSRTTNTCRKRSKEVSSGDVHGHRHRRKRSETNGGRRHDERDRRRIRPQHAGGRDRPRNVSRSSITVYVLQEPPSAAPFDPKILGVGWTKPSGPASKHPTVSAVLTTGVIPPINTFMDNRNEPNRQKGL